ncbi:hypothetical protein M1843_06445 [Isoptericola sp. 4D.3]|uniref:Uncharacterized protein n=1 Tax=Isoptericola peretonis TaxID=2918523 RepID=A0ABT0J1K1_9MICO|nr:hypothetical protein [Isoptericola sp. 4D.3]
MGGTGGRSARRWLPLRLLVVVVVVLLAVVVALLVRQPARLVLASYPGLPAGVAAAPPHGEPGWLLGDDGRLAVYAAGSGSCPWRPTSVTAEGDRVRVQLGRDERGACTDDLVWTTSVVALPAGVDHGRLEVEIATVEPAG